MSSTELVKALIKDNSIASEFDRLNLWGKFYSRDWCKLLSSQPQFWIYWPEESVNKIKEDPTKAKECKSWKRFNSSGWSNLLKSQPQFADKYTEYKGWERINSSHWLNLLSSQPQFANKCNWSKMRANNYDEYDEDEYEDFEYWEAEYGVDYSEDWGESLICTPPIS